MSIEIDTKKIKDLLVQKWHTFGQYIEENKRLIFRFQIGMFSGILIWIAINSVFAIGSFIISLPFGILAILLIFFAKLLGIEDEAYKFWNRACDAYEIGETADTSFDFFPSVPNLVADIIELFNAVMASITRIGKVFFETLTISFPVLLDIQINTDWLHVSLPYLFRTVFNLIQFILLFYFTRKIRNRVKQRVKDEIKLKSYVWFPK